MGTDASQSIIFHGDNLTVDQKIKQLELTYELNKEKVEGDFGKLDQKINGSLELRKWLTMACVGIFGVIVAVLSLVGFFIFNSLSSYKDLQNNYYQLLIQNKEDINKFILNSEIKNSCFKNDSYWEFKVCLNNL